MDHGRTHVKAWLFWVDEKVKQEKKTYAAAPDLVDEERKKKEKKESKVKLKTEQIEKTCRAEKPVTVTGFWTKPATVTGWAVSKNC
jgi:hypothetical protein